MSPVFVGNNDKATKLRYTLLLSVKPQLQEIFYFRF